MCKHIKLYTWTMSSSLYTTCISIKIFSRSLSSVGSTKLEQHILRTQPFDSKWRLNKNTLTLYIPPLSISALNILVWEWTWVWGSKNLDFVLILLLMEVCKSHSFLHLNLSFNWKANYFLSLAELKVQWLNHLEMK